MSRREAPVQIQAAHNAGARRDVWLSRVVRGAIYTRMVMSGAAMCCKQNACFFRQPSFRGFRQRSPGVGVFGPEAAEGVARVRACGKCTQMSQPMWRGKMRYGEALQRSARKGERPQV